jgi:hypothetical protein
MGADGRPHRLPADEAGEALLARDVAIRVFFAGGADLRRGAVTSCEESERKQANSHARFVSRLRGGCQSNSYAIDSAY